MVALRARIRHAGGQCQPDDECAKILILAEPRISIWWRASAPAKAEWTPEDPSRKLRPVRGDLVDDRPKRWRPAEALRRMGGAQPWQRRSSHTSMNRRWKLEGVVEDAVTRPAAQLRREYVVPDPRLSGRQVADQGLRESRHTGRAGPAAPVLYCRVLP